MAQTTWNVVITQRNFDASSLLELESHGCVPQSVPLAVGQGDGDLDEDALAAALAEADAWIVGHAHVTRSLLARLPRLQVVCRRGVGYERVDTQAVRDLGKVATIAVGGNDAAVADHALGLMLAVAHRFREGQLRLACGDWSIPVGTDLFRKTVGVVGLGRIGRGVVARLRGFDCRVLVCDPVADERYAAESGVTFTDLDTLLAQSDYVSLHAPLTDETRHMIGREALARMQRTAILVNTARGGLVDDAALLEALQQGRIAGAGLDVFASEADPASSPATQALLQLPTVVATPHSGGSTTESLQRTNLIAARNAVAVLQGARPDAACVIADGRASGARGT